MQEEVTCPACIKRNRTTKLLLKQISFESAVYLCPLKKCRYPKGFLWLVVKRSFDEFSELICAKKQQEKEKKSADNDFLQDLLQSNSQDDGDVLSSILSDLNNITVAEATDNGQHLHADVFDSLKELEINDKELPAERTNETSVPLDTLNTDVFSTSVSEILTEFIDDSTKDDKDNGFNIDDFLWDDVLQF